MLVDRHRTAAVIELTSGQALLEVTRADTF